jgi:DNA mismatch endonuclease (patch repair protein)
LPGKPDIVFPTQRIAIFVDGDFGHGKNLHSRLVKLSQGHNAMYWTAKIAANHARDKRTRAMLKRSGWTVLRVWESDLNRCLESITQRIVALVRNKQLSSSFR